MVIGETSEKLELLTREAERVQIAMTSIAERRIQELSAMPAGLVQKPAELRDILAFLVASTGAR